MEEARRIFLVKNRLVLGPSPSATPLPQFLCLDLLLDSSSKVDLLQRSKDVSHDPIESHY